MAVYTDRSRRAWHTLIIVVLLGLVGVAGLTGCAAAAVFSEPSGVPAWKTLPSWAVVSTGDKAAGTDVTLSMAKRAKATITEVDGSHLIMVSQPDVVTDVILQAARAQS